MMDNELYYKYLEQFGCRITVEFFTNQLSLVTPEKKLFSVEEATEEELNALMRESVDKGENVLLKKFQDKEYTVEVKPGCDY